MQKKISLTIGFSGVTFFMNSSVFIKMVIVNDNTRLTYRYNLKDMQSPRNSLHLDIHPMRPGYITDLSVLEMAAAFLCCIFRTILSVL